METQTKAKRVVSKGEYLRALMKRFFWWIDGLLLYVATFLFVLVVIGFASGILRFAPLPFLRGLATTEWVWLLLFFPLIIYFCSAGARWCLTRSRTIETGVPLLMRTASLLPPPSSLVRASLEPPEAQQSVLLRSASWQERHEDQLLRVVTQQETT